MAASKLFTPVVRTKRGTAGDETCHGMFYSPPYHASIPRQENPADTGPSERTLKLRGDGNSYAEPVGKRGFKTYNGKIDY